MAYFIICILIIHKNGIYFIDSFDELRRGFVRVDIFVNVPSCMAHYQLYCALVYPCVVKGGFGCVAAIVRGMVVQFGDFALEPTVTQKRIIPGPN